ncbi:NAD(P)/FAD-dependent oxidoreductase [Paenibacillus vietnamensis]|uniref:NAD(P)/FAD-dependent oxidoreductase n=1 Tax=Paenibacillus vietnamensis TaxID=2590547 RepID=UPI001CD18EF5|nr:NAD(P)/FAD-dependent oxidoreductase [Paenibacillus vietnamensis]
MSQHFDIIVVGARVAGSALAYELSRSGYSVLLLDKSRFPSDTLSTHNFYGNSLAMLEEMGILPKLLQTGTPTYKRAVIRFEDAVIDGEFPESDGRAECLCIRRTHLDDLMFKHASSQQSVTAMEGFRLTDVIRDGGTVTGIEGIDRNGIRQRFYAKLVVGADGRRSTLRDLVNSKCKLAVPTDYASYVGYYEGYSQNGELHAELYKMNDKLSIVFPTSDNLYVVGVMFPLDSAEWVERFKQSPELAMQECIESGFAGSPLQERMRQASLVGRVRGLLGYDNDWHEGMGAGWALTGDALSFKDPAVGQGMQDALFGARILTDVLTSFPDWSRSWKEMAASYERLMEEKMMFHFQLACQYTKNAPFTPEQMAVNRLIASDPIATKAFLGIYNRATEPLQFAQVLADLASGCRQ